jgi:hypothetical protein
LRKGLEERNQEEECAEGLPNLFCYWEHAGDSKKSYRKSHMPMLPVHGALDPWERAADKVTVGLRLNLKGSLPT